MTIATASPALIPFTARHEGRVHRAYRDAGGVVTIGIGFTDLSKIFAVWWRDHRGHGLRLGDTISDGECDLLLALLIDTEYAPPVAARFAGTGIRQHEFDAATDLCFNCGPGSLKWSWAGALAARSVDAAAAKLKVTAVTAGGRRLSGLVRRRSDEARLMAAGDYGQERQSAAGSPPIESGEQSADDVRAFQAKLAALGLYTGAIDGIAGPATRTAVRVFQGGNGLIVDGIAGPATRATLARVVAARRAGQAAGGTAVTAGVAGGGAELAHDPSALDGTTLLAAGAAALIVAALVLGAFLLWRYRGVILRRRTPA